LNVEHQEVVVIGGTGFIGSHLAQHLVTQGHRVRVASRQAVDAQRVDPNITYIRADVTEPDNVVRVIAGASVVFHLATGACESWSDLQRNFARGVGTVAQACQQQRVKRLVYTSSIAALDLSRPGRIDERAGADRKANGRNLYSRGKIAAEQVLRDFHEQSGLPVVIVRPGIVVGRGGTLNHSGVGTWPSDTCCVGWGRGDIPLPFVLVGDLVRALYAAMHVPEIDGMSFNVVGDVRPTALKFVQLVAGLSRRNVRFYPQSVAVRQVVEAARWVLKRAAGRPCTPFPGLRDLKSSSLQTQIDNSSAKLLLDWKPTTSMDQFVREAIYPHLTPRLAGDLRADSPGVKTDAGR